jgi:hypothetical protein
MKTNRENTGIILQEGIKCDQDGHTYSFHHEVDDDFFAEAYDSDDILCGDWFPIKPLINNKVEFNICIFDEAQDIVIVDITYEQINKLRYEK